MLKKPAQEQLLSWKSWSQKVGSFAVESSSELIVDINPFAADGDGIVIAEGAAVIVLKRLSDALRDGDRVYAVIKGIGSSSDGKSLGLTAPRKEGQVRALRRAYERSNICLLYTSDAATKA